MGLGGMSDAVRVPENFQYLRPDQEASIQQETRSIDQMLASPVPGGMDKGEMRKRKRALEKMLAEQQAPDLNAEQRDAFSREARRLEAEFTVGMPSAEEMRKNPPGAVDRNLAWHYRHRRTVARWKNIMRALHKGDTSPDIANVERFRPHHTAADLSMTGAQIPGRLFVGTNPTTEYRENYDRIFGDAKAKPAIEPVSDEWSPPAKDTERPRKQRKKPNIEHLKTAMRCGRVIDRRGRRFHEAQCTECQRLSQQPKQSEAAEAPPAAE